VFAAEGVCSAANQHSLPKLCCLQQKCDSLPKLSCLWRISIHCQKRIGCNKVAFVAKIEALAVKQFSLPNCAAYSETVFAAELCGPRQISFPTDFLQ
jgi:hypothetical protein